MTVLDIDYFLELVRGGVCSFASPFISITVPYVCVEHSAGLRVRVRV